MKAHVNNKNLSIPPFVVLSTSLIHKKSFSFDIKTEVDDEEEEDGVKWKRAKWGEKHEKFAIKKHRNM